MPPRYEIPEIRFSKPVIVNYAGCLNSAVILDTLGRACSVNPTGEFIRVDKERMFETAEGREIWNDLTGDC